MRRIKPLKRRVDEALRVLAKEGFRIVAGSDSGWFGDGMYILTNDRESLRITRSRREEFLDIAFNANPRDQDWIGIAELMVAVSDITFEDAVSGDMVRHDLNFKLDAYLRIRPLIAEQLGEHPAAHQKLQQVRQRSRQFARETFGK